MARTGWPAGPFFAACLLCGCEGGLHQMLTIPGFPSASQLQAQSLEEDKMRREFQETRNPAAIRWLLANRVKQGMSVGEVNGVLGCDGKRRYEDAQFKSRNIGVLASDETYAWGPDHDGSPYMLFFRNDHLVNYDPAQFADADAATLSFD